MEMDKSNYRIREATEKDAEGVLRLFRLVAASFDTILTSEGEFNYTQEEEKIILSQWADNGNSIFLVAEGEEGQMGMLGFQGGKRRRERHCGTLGMSVHPDWQGRAIGRGLLKTLVDWAEKPIP
jgi:GNAT superfamily N-acetyltransferase